MVGSSPTFDGVVYECKPGEEITIKRLAFTIKRGYDKLIANKRILEEKCPLCAQGVPINTDVGKGREFMARKGSKM